MTTQANRTNIEQQAALDLALTELRQILERLRYGSINLTVHENRLVQIDVTEKRRLAPR
jgi:hypothetical protein